MKHPPINNMNTEEEDIYNKALKDSGYALTNREEDIASIFFYAGLNAVLSSTEEGYIVIGEIYNPTVDLTTQIQEKFDNKIEACDFAVDFYNKDPEKIRARVFQTRTTPVFEVTKEKGVATS